MKTLQEVEKKRKADIEAAKPKGSKRGVPVGAGRRHRGLSGVATLSEDHYAFCWAFAKTNNTEGAAAYAGLHPKGGYRLLRDPAILAEILRCKEELRAREGDKAEKAFEIDRSYVSVKTVHFLETFQTHERRGDADRAKVLEIAARCTGQIQPLRIVNHNQAGATAFAQGSTVKEVYRSRWMIDNEEKIRLQLEAENAPPAVNESTNLTS